MTASTRPNWLKQTPGNTTDHFAWYKQVLTFQVGHHRLALLLLPADLLKRFKCSGKPALQPLQLRLLAAIFTAPSMQMFSQLCG